MSSRVAQRTEVLQRIRNTHAEVQGLLRKRGGIASGGFSAFRGKPGHAQLETFKKR